jgi:hypothetical protein
LVLGRLCVARTHKLLEFFDFIWSERKGVVHALAIEFSVGLTFCREVGDGTDNADQIGV